MCSIQSSVLVLSFGWCLGWQGEPSSDVVQGFDGWDGTMWCSLRLGWRCSGDFDCSFSPGFISLSPEYQINLVTRLHLLESCFLTYWIQDHVCMLVVRYYNYCSRSNGGLLWSPWTVVNSWPVNISCSVRCVILLICMQSLISAVHLSNLIQ